MVKDAEEHLLHLTLDYWMFKHTQKLHLKDQSQYSHCSQEKLIYSKLPG